MSANGNNRARLYLTIEYSDGHTYSVSREYDYTRIYRTDDTFTSRFLLRTQRAIDVIMALMGIGIVGTWREED